SVPALIPSVGSEMKKLCFCSAAAGLMLAACLGAGCGKKADTKNTNAAGSSDPQSAAAAAKAAPAAKLSGSQEVLSAIDKKDYDGAIAILLQIRQTVRTPEQQVQFANIADEARIKLLEAGPSDPKVAKALSVLRQITGGR